MLREEVLERIGETSEPLAALARAYLHRIPWDVALSPDLAYREVVGLFDFIENRVGPVAVRVFNPSVATYGYESSGTVVEIHVDDGPFLVDSVTGELQAHGLAVVRVLHPVIGTVRDASGALVSIQPARDAATRESVQHYQLDRTLDPAEHLSLATRLETVLGDALLAVRDFPAMIDATTRMAEMARAGRAHYPDIDVEEAVAFLDWLCDENFVFLGYREYRILNRPEGRVVETVADSGLGILSDPAHSKSSEPIPLSSMPPELRHRYEEGDLLTITKTNRLSTVHRRARMNYVGVRLVGPEGETVGEARLLGLFTSKAYMESVSRIPILRHKLAEIISAGDLIEGSHDHKAITALLESFPKDELFGLPTEDLSSLLMGLLALEERAKVRLFVRRQLLDRGVRVLVAMPRERYSSELAERLQDLFLERFGGSTVDHHLTLGKSDIARLHFVVWNAKGNIPDPAFEELEAEVMALTRSWAEHVAGQLELRHDPNEATAMVGRWAARMPDYYKASTQLIVAAGDFERLDELMESGARSLVGLQNEAVGPDILTRVTLYEVRGKRPLSELTPALEDMGMQVVEEVFTRLSGDENLFIHDFGVRDAQGELIDIEAAGERIARCLEAVWADQAESDSLNRLVMVAGLDHHQVGILRAYHTYWRRVSSIFTVNYVNAALVAHPELAARLIRLFELRFDPALEGDGYEQQRIEVLERLDAVPSLDEDRILRGFFRMIEATLRTNAYRQDRRALAIKLRSADVPDMPSPKPHVEVFVIGDDVEGIHLRAGPRARGGIRWSERREDYRTEVLGLMKAQITKNAIIVPTGAKGGFVLRHTPEPGAMNEAVRSAYEVFIRGLLDITDNLVEGEIVHPWNVRVHDGPDPYLVVAADKGTARFSDLANLIADEYGFWLDDAFASGSATGYDHKGLGITARGAWKSLERHFLTEGIDPHRHNFTAVGIGDMSGDVFGNGMLGSETIKLVAAFDHRHVFVDPDPDPATSFQERKRIFDLPSSSWDDYDRALISEGGGVFARSLKQIKLSEPARKALGTEAVAVTPAELIRIVLRAPVDLLWNGGVGTYVKATEESHEEVGDRSNDSVRIDGLEVRARVVVEGGNLGLTQRGRVEYCQAGGRINTDFIDNSGGVNCSDREVNLKILLRLAEQRGEIGRNEAEKLRERGADSVVEAVLLDSLEQTQLLARAERASADAMDAYEQLMVSLEHEGMLVRDLEWLPSTQRMTDRARAGTGLGTPELAVLVAYAKRSVADQVLASDLPDSRSMLPDLASYFPNEISERFGDLIWDHPLRRELISTIVAKDVVDSQGPTFVLRLVLRSGAAPAAVVAAYRAARDLVGGTKRRREIEQLFGSVDHRVWNEMMDANERLVGALTRWHLGRLLGRALDGVADLERELEEWGSPEWRQERDQRIQGLEAAGVPTAVARQTVSAPDLLHGPNIIEVARAAGRPRIDVGRVFHRIGRVLGLDDLEKALSELRSADPWQRWALETIEDDALAVRRSLAERVLGDTGLPPANEALERFLAERADAVARVVELVQSLEAGTIGDIAPLMVVLRQIQALASDQDRTAQ